MKSKKRHLCSSQIFDENRETLRAYFSKASATQRLVSKDLHQNLNLGSLRPSCSRTVRAQLFSGTASGNEFMQMIPKEVPQL